MSRLQVLPGLAAQGYRRHALHGEDAIWVEKNCYGDLWIEVLHALGVDPVASLGYTIGIDFEGDQWTFFKPPHGDLRQLYGVDIHELTIWRPLLDHAVEFISSGKLLSIEVDAWWLPDTAGTDYRRQHTKTTIAIASLDPQAQQLGYFHNAGYFELDGEDFARIFAVEPGPDGFLPPYAEFVRIDRLVKRAPQELARISWELLRDHYEWRPATNPFTRFGERLVQDMPGFLTAGLARYHAWAFASVRQAGAAFELAAAHLRWHAGFGRPELSAAAESFDAIAQGNKALILKAARAVNSGRPLDAAPLCAELALAWDRGMSVLGESLEKSAA
jgi:hypothetical protein